MCISFVRFVPQTDLQRRGVSNHKVQGSNAEQKDFGLGVATRCLREKEMATHHAESSFRLCLGTLSLLGTLWGENPTPIYIIRNPQQQIETATQFTLLHNYKFHPFSPPNEQQPLFPCSHKSIFGRELPNSERVPEHNRNDDSSLCVVISLSLLSIMSQYPFGNIFVRRSMTELYDPTSP
ncbi:hypothetical protein CDAR_126911 [Caerostris darwini]|uniref:Uncharacterized protein n=1 Tax=Caerostris darwini TaxID=1538125 RepID=A0AAV4T5T0_9ARAC|nr:hypothetical protein CDAR_126911 [Caerostris darwini]